MIEKKIIATGTCDAVTHDQVRLDAFSPCSCVKFESHICLTQPAYPIPILLESLQHYQ
jgi:hypothetical protein